MSIEDKFNFAESFVIFEDDSRYIGQAYALRFSYQSSKNPLPPAAEILTALTIPQIKNSSLIFKAPFMSPSMSMNFLTKQVVINTPQTFNDPRSRMIRVNSAAVIVSAPAFAANNAAASRELCAGNNMARP